MSVLEPKTRKEVYLNAIAENDTAGLPTPKTREELYLDAIARNDKSNIPSKPLTRTEKYLEAIVENGGGDVTIEALSVTENGIYTAPSGTAYTPVTVEVPQTVLDTLNVTENGTYTAEEGHAYDEVNVSVPLPQDAYLIKSASGTIATFTDGQDLVMPKCEAEIEPQQDLHGYDAPWAGGAGKNKFDISSTSDTAEDNDGNEYSAYGVKTDNTFVFQTGLYSRGIWYRFGGLQFSANTTVTISADVLLPNTQGLTSDSVYLALKSLSDNAKSETGTNVTIGTKTHVTGTVTLLANVKYDQFRIQAGGNVGATSNLNCQVTNVQIEIDSNATSYAPYSNICPISGFDGVNITNQSDLQDETTKHVTSVSWQTEAGTVYGGKVDLISGVLTVDRVYYQFDDSTTYTITGSARLTNNRWITSITNVQNVSGEIKNRSSVISSISPRDEEIATTTVSGFCRNLSSPYPIINLNDSDSGLSESSSATDIANAVNTFVHQYTPQIVYELATPITYQLNPTAIKSLLGNNNVFADTNGDVSLQYFSKEG